MTPHKQDGFILYECLISLIILSIVLTTMIQTLPHLLTLKTTLNKEQLIFQKLYEMKDLMLYQEKHFPASLHLDSPIPYEIKILDQRICAHYMLGNKNEKTMCL